MTQQQSLERRVIVVGAGIVGVSCALALQKRGYQVTVIDRLEPGEACSYGNAGVIATSSCVPLIMPGTLRKAPGWLLRRDGPLAMDWRYLPRMAGWLYRASGYTKASDLKRISRALYDLHSRAVEDHMEQAQDAGCADILDRSRYLHVYETAKGYQGDAPAWELRRDLGLSFEVLGGKDLPEIEPALAPIFAKGVLLEGHAVARNPGRLVKALARDFEARQGRLVRGEVREIQPDSDGRVAVKTSEDVLEAGHLVLAAGAWSAELSHSLGHRFPLVSERGYHVMFEEPGVRLRQPVMFADGKFVANTMEEGLRLAGTAEFAAIDRPASDARVDVIRQAARRFLPTLNGGRTHEWMGARPSLPDTLPVIGRSHLHSSVYFAFGHGHTGLTASATTAKIVAAVVAGETPPIDIHAFRPERFPYSGKPGSS